MTHRFFLEKKNKLLICFHSFISSVIQKSYDFTNFILKIDVLSVCYALFYPDRAFLFCPCLLIKLSLKLGSLILEWDSNSVLEYAPILLYQFSKLPTKIGRSIFNLNHTKKRVSNCNFTSFFEFEFTVFFRNTILLVS